METKLSILFYGKKNLLNSENLLAIYMRVTINGKRFEVSTQRYVEPGRWSGIAGKMKGNSEEVRSLNQFLDSLKQRIYDYQKAIMQEGKPFTKESLWQRWHGKSEHALTLVEVFKHHNKQLEALIGISNSASTFGKYRTTLDHTISFLKWKFGRADIELSGIGLSRPDIG